MSRVTESAQKTQAEPPGSEDPMYQAVRKLCRDVLAPLVRADGGVMHLVAAGSEEVHIHLSGTCAGCPGAATTRQRVLEPAIRTVAPKATLRVTTSWRPPPGAELID